MSNPNQQDPMLLNTTTNRPNSLTRNGSKGRAEAVPIDIPTGERERPYNNILRRNDNLTSYRPSNMPPKQLPSHAATVPSVPPRRAHRAAPSTNEVITIDDVKRKRKVVECMKANQYSRRQSEDNQPQKQENQRTRTLRSRQIDHSPPKRRRDFNVIKNDSDEEITTPAPKKTFKRLVKGKSTKKSDSSDTDLDEYKDTKDVFDIDSVEPASEIPRKRPLEGSLWEQSKRQQEQAEGQVLRKRWQNIDNADTADDVWEQQVSDISTSKSPAKEDPEKPASEDVPSTEFEIPPLHLPKRRKPIVFHTDADDIPDRRERGPKTKTTTYRSENFMRRMTRSATMGIRKFLGQPQYITIDDDDEVMESEGSSSPRADQSEQRVLFHYPTSTPGGVTVIREDANRLMDGEMLNDSIIDFYVKWLLETLGSSNTENVHIFNTFFYARLKQVTKGDPYESVKKWTTKINLFEKDTIFVPINECSHWYLLVICNVRRCIPSEDNYIDLSNDDSDDNRAMIYSLDSMGITRRATANRIIKYLQSAAKDRLGVDEGQFKKPKYQKATVPLQPNAYDCGIYVLHFIETFLLNPSGVMSVLTKKELDDDIWQQKTIDEKRSYITELIAGLCQEQAPADAEAETTTDAPSTPTTECPDTPTAVYTSAA